TLNLKTYVIMNEENYKSKFRVLLLALFIIGVNRISFAQNKTITGTVTDTNNIPLMGVSIIVKGTKTGVATDYEGMYSISGVEPGSTLVFSMVGFIPKEIPVGD